MPRHALSIAITLCGLITSAAWAQPAAPSRPAKPPNPSELPISESYTYPNGDSIGLSLCFAKGDTITCKFVVTHHGTAPADYKFGLQDGSPPYWMSRLVDNLNIDHKLVDGYIQNGRGDHVKTMNVDSGGAFVVSEDFGGASTEDVDKIRVIFPGTSNWRTFTLHGSLTPTQ